MQIRSFQARLWILALILGFGFALRLNSLAVPDLSLDETWSYVNSYYLAHPRADTTPAQFLVPEPNNDLHLILVALNLEILSGAFGMRWLSVLVGLVSVALAARIAFRLYGRSAALMAALITAFAYVPVTYSQIARPYALATMLALFSLLFWVEKRARLNMLASMLVPIAHIGALPVVAIQDFFTLRRIWRHQYVNKLDWIVRRIVVYAPFLLIVYLTYLRRTVHVISSGQTPPSPAELLDNVLNLLVNGFPALTPATLIFLAGVVLPLIILALTRWRRLPKNLDVPIFWIVTTYGFLIAGAVFSDGPIKWIHITHVAVALALLMAALLARAPQLVRAGVLCAFLLSSSLSLLDYYREPGHYWGDTRAQIDRLRRGDETIYVGQSMILWSFQLNNSTATYIEYLPAAEQRPAHYLYVEVEGWDPRLPPPNVTPRRSGRTPPACGR